MPIYVYKCDNCGEFEQQQSINDEAFTKCPKCGSLHIRRMVTNTAGVIMRSSVSKNITPSIPEQCQSCANINKCDKIK